jgi:CHAT domain-containing protein
MNLKELIVRRKKSVKLTFSLCLFFCSFSLFNSFLKVRATEIKSGQQEDIFVKQKYYKNLNNLLNKPIENEPKISSIYFDRQLANKFLARENLGTSTYSNTSKKFQQAQNEERERLNLVISQVKQAQTYMTQGQIDRAISLLEKVINTVKQQNAPSLLASAQKNLGDAYKLSGNYDRAVAAYEVTLKGAKNYESSTEALNGLTDVLTRRSKQHLMRAKDAYIEKNQAEVVRCQQLARADRDLAIEYAWQALEKSKGEKHLATVRAWLNWQKLSKEYNKNPRPLDPNSPDLQIVKPKRINLSAPKQVNSPQIITMLDELPDSRSKIYLAIKLAQEEPKKDLDILKGAVKAAQKIGDNRALSFAFGEIGKSYQKRGSLTQAIDYTQKAQLAAEQAIAFDSLYRWQWQAGKLYRKKGETESAKNSYRAAIASLQSIQSNIISSEKQQQFSFQDEAEPIYREMLALLLEDRAKPQFSEALKIADLLQLSELQSFFGDDCLKLNTDAKPQEFLKQNNAALIRSIVLNDKTYLILQLPDGSLKKYPINLNKQELESKILSWRFYLEKLSQRRYITGSKSLYNLMMRPMERDLQQANPSRIIFVNDGILRNVPMAALYDGSKFLIEKYAISYSLGLNLEVDRQKKDGDLLAFGLSVPVNNFPPLPFVKQEIGKVEKIEGGKQFLDREFTKDKLIEEIEEGYSLVHIATHGKFGGDAEGAFIQAFDGKISLLELEKILARSSTKIKLLVLSACETATGNNRSVLGLAGMAARAGVATTVGSLWALNDEESVQLISDFYSNLADANTSKAEALRRAQLNQIKQVQGHPGLWASLIVIE